jgi:hypothetical protein
MNRFQWGETTADHGEIHVTSQTGVALYDGEEKVYIHSEIPLVF